MYYLSLDSSTKKFSIAISKNDQHLKHRSFILEKALSSSIIPKIGKLLKDSKLKLDEISVFAVGLGPGSFTSLRVGLSTIKAFAFEKDKKVIGIASLDVIAMNVRQEKVQICVISDARRNMVYSCIYSKNSGLLKKKSKYMLVGIKDVIKKIKGKAVFVGDGIPLYKTEIENSGKLERFEDKKYWFPDARQLAVLARVKMACKEFDECSKLVPLYLYPEDCQVVREQISKGK